MLQNIALISSVMIISGAMGGYAGYLLGPVDAENSSPKSRKGQLWKSILLGIVAAIIVPLFIEVAKVASATDSNLVDKLFEPNASLRPWLVFIGLCLVASISGQRFIGTVASSVLQQKLDKIDRNIVILNEDVEDVSEAVAVPETIAGKLASRFKEDGITDDAAKALKDLYRNAERRPSKGDIMSSGDWNAAELDKALNELEQNGLVKSKDYEGIERWRVRTAGKSLIAMGMLPDGTPEKK